MTDLSSLASKWDANFACFFIQKLIDANWLLQEDTALGSIEHLKNLSKHFAEQAINQNEKTNLSPMDEELLEQQWLKILTYENKKLLPNSVLSVPRNITELKVCLVNVGTYIMFKNRRRRSDLEFAVNILSMALGAVRDCIQDGLIEESERLLNLALCSIRPRMDDETVYDFDATPSEKLHLKFKSCCCSLFVYRVLSHYRQEQYGEILAMLGSTKQEPMEFDIDQSDSLSRICFNIALGMFNRREFQSAVIWLKFAHSFGKQVMESGLKDDCTEDALTLLAACYMQIDITKHWSQIIEILDYGDQTVVNLELRLQAMLVGEKEVISIQPSILRYLTLKYQDNSDPNSIKKAANELFSLIEEKKGRSFLMQLLSHIPWVTNQTAIQSKSKEESCLYVPHIRWICAKYAVRCFLADNETDKFFKLLCEVQHWSYENADDAAIYEFMSLAETVALRLVNEEGNLEACMRWYEIIIQFANRHGIDSSVIWNAMACLLQLPHHKGFHRAQKLTSMIPEYDSWADLDPLCIRLQMALGAEDYDAALQITFDLENIGQENDWDKIQRAISRSASIANSNGLLCPMLNYLETAAQKCKTTYMKAILLRFVLRFQMDILRNESNEKKEQLLTNMLNTVSTAYTTTKDAQNKDHLLIEIRTWFARTAWNLGRIAIKQSAYFRHHLFKLSSQFFSLETGWMKETEIAMVKAMEAAFDFGPNGKRIAYVRILQSALDVANGFYQYSKGTERAQLIRLMEFHALCELKDWQKVETLFRNYADTAGKDVSSAQHDAGFFQSLASIIISTKDAKMCKVVTTECGDDTFQRDRVSAQQQTCLTSLAVTSLKMAIDLSMPAGNTLSTKIILCCRWIVGVLFNPYTIREPIALKENLPLLDELKPWLRSSDFPFPEILWIFRKIWNCTLLCPDQKFKWQIARWLEQGFKQSPHYPKLMKLFKDQFDYISSPWS